MKYNSTGSKIDHLSGRRPRHSHLRLSHVKSQRRAISELFTRIKEKMKLVIQREGAVNVVKYFALASFGQIKLCFFFFLLWWVCCVYLNFKD